MIKARGPGMVLLLTEACLGRSALGNSVTGRDVQRVEGLAALSAADADRPVLVPLTDPVLWLADRLQHESPEVAVGHFLAVAAQVLALALSGRAGPVVLVDDRALMAPTPVFLTALGRRLGHRPKVQRLPPQPVPRPDLQSLVEALFALVPQLGGMLEDWRGLVLGAKAPTGGDILAAAEIWHRAALSGQAEADERIGLRALAAAQADRIAELTRAAAGAGTAAAGDLVAMLADPAPPLLAASIAAMERRLEDARILAAGREAVLVAQILADGTALARRVEPATPAPMPEPVAPPPDDRHALEAELAALRAERAQIFASKSWRLTEPLRALRRLAGRQ